MEFDQEPTQGCTNENCSPWTNGTGEDGIEEEWAKVLYKVTPFVLTGNLIVLMLGMGAASNFFDVWDIVRRPGKLLLGMTCQAMLLPVVGFGLIILLPEIPTQQALGIAILSCSPSGALANFFTFWLNGDLALSIIMTAFSGLVAFLTMPITLWLFGQYTTEKGLIIPYRNIAIGVAFVAIPCLLGMTIRHFRRRIAILLTKLSSVLGLLGILIAGTMMALTHWQILLSTTKMGWIAASMLPFLLFICPFVISKIFCMNNKVARTIAVCCCSQNFTVLMNLVIMSYAAIEDRDEALRIPILYVIFHKMEIFLLVGIYQLYKFAHRNDVTEEDVVSVIDNKLLHRISFANHTSFTSLLEDSNRQYEILKRSRNQSPSPIGNLSPLAVDRTSYHSDSRCSGRLSDRASSLCVEDYQEALPREHSDSTMRLSDLEARVASDLLQRTDPSTDALYDMAPYTPIYVFNTHAIQTPVQNGPRYEFKTFGDHSQRGT